MKSLFSGFVLLGLLAAFGAFGFTQTGGFGISGRVRVAGSRNNADAVIYIDKIPGKTFTPHETAKMDQFNLSFVPHVLPVLVGTTVLFPNSDPIRHNVFSSTPPKFNLGTYDVGKTMMHTFNVPGEVDLLCNVHAEMSAFIIVTETPYFAVSDASGEFLIRNVPPGHYTLKAWAFEYKPGTLAINVASQDLKGINLDLKK